MGASSLWRVVGRLERRKPCRNPNHYACRNVLHSLPPHRGHKAGLLTSLRRDLADIGAVIAQAWQIVICS